MNEMSNMLSDIERESQRVSDERKLKRVIRAMLNSQGVIDDGERPDLIETTEWLAESDGHLRCKLERRLTKCPDLIRFGHGWLIRELLPVGQRDCEDHPASCRVRKFKDDRGRVVEEWHIEVVQTDTIDYSVRIDKRDRDQYGRWDEWREVATLDAPQVDDPDDLALMLRAAADEFDGGA